MAASPAAARPPSSDMHILDRQAQSSSPQHDHARQHRVGWAVWLAIFSMGLGVGSNYGVSSNMLPSVVDRVAADFGSGAVTIDSWVSSAWLLGGATTFAISGRLADIFGKRPIIIGGNLLAFVAFIIATFTSSFTVLIFALALNGAATGFVANAFAATAEILPNRYRPYGIAFLELSIAPTGYIGGSAIAHIIIENTGQWRWIPRIGMILTGVATILVTLTYWPPKDSILQRRDGRTKWQELVHLDWVGLLLLGGGLASFLMGVIWAAGLYPASDAHVIAPIVVGLISIAAFAAWEGLHRKEDALIPSRLFKGKAVPMSAVLVVKFVAATTFFSQIIIWPQQSAIMYADSYIQAGVFSLPAGFGTLAGGVILSAFLQRIKHTQWQLRVGITMQVAFTAAMAGLTPESKSTAFALQFFSNFPFIWIINLAYLTAQFLNEPADIAVASGLTATTRAVGGAVGVAVYVSILTSRIPAVIPPLIAAAALSNGLPPTSLEGLIGAILGGGDVLAVPGVTPAIAIAAGAAAKEGFSQVFRTVYLSTLGFGVVGIIASFFVVDISHNFTDEVAVTLETDKSRHATAEHDLERHEVYGHEDVKA